MTSSVWTGRVILNVRVWAWSADCVSGSSAPVTILICCGEAGAQLSGQSICPYSEMSPCTGRLTKRISAWVQVPLQGTHFFIRVWGACQPWGKLQASSCCSWIKKYLLSRFGHLTKMLSGQLELEIYPACPTGGRPWGRPRTCQRDRTNGWLGNSLRRWAGISGSAVEMFRLPY